VLHTVFGRWASRTVRPDADLVYGFSGVMEETLALAPRGTDQLRILCRGSAHIAVQDRILAEEAIRVSAPVERPSRWMVAREQREYEAAHLVHVLSRFARDSFLEQGFPPERLALLPLGVDSSRFRAAEGTCEERQHRILSGAPLRILTVGTFSYQKGARDLADIAAALSPRMRFRFVGARLSEVEQLARHAQAHIEMHHRVPEAALHAHYAWADVFLFTTLQDGFAAVLMQALAAGLPIVSTANCGAPDVVHEGETGFILPARSRAGFISRLDWCDRNRPALARMAAAAANGTRTRHWTELGQALIDALQSHRAGTAR
jgi:glycosyltransferase involved in cell wall biosynthesis